ncbi:Uncharacterised protein [Yokenella regensburgei]|nr:Uncharacterised protein [Yokenella regensburgei]
MQFSKVDGCLRQLHLLQIELFGWRLWGLGWDGDQGLKVLYVLQAEPLQQQSVSERGQNVIILPKFAV